MIYFSPAIAMVTNISPGDTSSSSRSTERKDLTAAASVVITVDSPSKSCSSPGHQAAATEPTSSCTTGDTSIPSTPTFAPNSESTPLKKKTNINNLRNSLTMRNNTPLPDQEQLISQTSPSPLPQQQAQQQLSPSSGGQLQSEASADATTAGTAGSGAGLSARIGVGSLSLPQVFGRSKIMSQIPSKEGGGDSTCSDYVRTSDEVSCWWSHPKIRENWRVFVAAFGLLILGTALIVMGIAVCVLPEIGFQSYVFFIAGFFCFIPGAYHVVYVYCAVKGRKGYDFYQLPLFN